MKLRLEALFRVDFGLEVGPTADFRPVEVIDDVSSDDEPELLRIVAPVVDLLTPPRARLCDTFPEGVKVKREVRCGA